LLKLGVYDRTLPRAKVVLTARALRVRPVSEDLSGFWFGKADACRSANLSTGARTKLGRVQSFENFFWT